MAKQLQFQLALSETFSKVLAPVLASLGQINTALAGAVGGVNRLESAMAGSKGGRFFTFDLAKGADMALGGIKAVTSAFVDLGRAIIKTAAGSQDLNLALRLNAGEGGAKAIGGLADSFKNTRFDDDTIKSALLPLTEVGFTDPKLLDNLATAAADISTRRNSGAAGLQSALEAFQKMGLKGEVDARALRELGIGEADFFKNLGDLMGISAENAKKRAAAGKVGSQTLLSVALDEIAKRQGGALGIASLEGGKTLGATLERLSNLSGNVFKKIADGPGMKAVQAGIEKFIELMDGPVGEALTQKIDEVFTGLGQVLTPDRIATFVEATGSVISFVGGVVTFAVDAFSTLLDMGEAVGEVIGAVFVKLTDWGGSLIKFVSELGVSIWQGLRDGIVGGISAVGDAVKGLGDSVVSKLKDVLGIASPSKVMAQMGGFTAEGFAIGLEDGSARVGSAARDSLGAPAIGGAGAGRGGGVSFGDIVVNVGGGDASGAEGVAQAIRVEIMRALDEVGFVAGAA